MSDEHALIPGLGLDAFLAQRDAMVDRVRRAHALLLEAGDLADHMVGLGAEGARAGSTWFQLGLSWEGGVRHRYRASFLEGDGLASYVKGIDASCWARLFALTGLASFMDHKAREEWDRQIQAHEVPELTRENIVATFAAMHRDRGLMFERGVVEVFRSLSWWDYKTNNPVMLGKKLVMRRVLSTWSHSAPSLNSEGCDRLDDLLRAMSILDGAPAPATRAYRRLSEAGWDRGAAMPWIADLGYFTLRGHKNGNVHLAFTRPDVVDKLNQIIAKHYPGALAPSREAA